MEAQLSYGKIQILDDVVPDALYKQLLAAAQQVRWKYGHTTKENPQMRYWHHEIGRGEKPNVEDISANVEKHPLQVFARFQEWLRSAIVPPETRVLRYYLNAHTYGTDGWPHTDTDRAKELTAILFLAPPWKPGWCGETVVFDAAGVDIEAAVLPRPNRLLVFPSDRLHAPRPLSKVFSGMRVVLVVKLAPPADGPALADADGKPAKAS